MSKYTAEQLTQASDLSNVLSRIQCVLSQASQSAVQTAALTAAADALAQEIKRVIVGEGQ